MNIFTKVYEHFFGAAAYSRTSTGRFKNGIYKTNTGYICRNDLIFFKKPGMSIGTKSILFGAHQFLIHPWFVAYAWWKLYSFPFDPRLWVAFFVHDLGYWGKPNMDGPEGEYHPVFGAKITRHFDKHWNSGCGYWYRLCLYHSRFLAKKHGRPYSKLCPADKLAVALEPWWLYLPRVILSGEIKEYMQEYNIKYKNTDIPTTRKAWFLQVKKFCDQWAYEYRNIKKDTWTKVD